MPSSNCLIELFNPLSPQYQLVPVIDAPVRAVVNYRLINSLGDTAINAYRQRWLATAGV